MKACTQCKARFTGNPARCPLDGAPLAELPDPMIGKLVGGRYHIEHKIGAGGMASVYRASHDLLGRKVAIKFLSPELALDPLQKERFLREARATNRIKHEHIIDISDYGEEENGVAYLVMELLEGETLAHSIARGPMPPREAIEYSMQVCRALARAHELEVIHRDLKPENIYVTRRDGRPHLKLLDFGLAHVRSEIRLTAMGSVFGTPEYMSPEQARGQPVGPTSDLYSLGIVFFEMLTSRLPFEGSTAELIVQHLSGSPPSISSIVPTVPTEIDAFVAKLLAKDVNKRHRDAYHVMDDLTALLTLLPESPRVEAPRRKEAAVSSARGGSDDLFASKVAVVSDENATTTVPISVRSWIERRAVYRQAVEIAYPRIALAPTWVEQGMRDLDVLVDQAVTIDSEMSKVARMLAEQEQSASDARGRIGRALDELARDESAVLRQIEEIERRAESGNDRTSAVVTDYRRAWSDASAVMKRRDLESIEVAEALEILARRATAWRQSIQQTGESGSLLEQRHAARDDLRFQVAQLKGRLGAMNADVEHELNAQRERASDLGFQMAETQERLAEVAGAVAQHLMTFPAAERLIGEQIPGRENLH